MSYISKAHRSAARMNSPSRPRPRQAQAPPRDYDDGPSVYPSSSSGAKPVPGGAPRFDSHDDFYDFLDSNRGPMSGPIIPPQTGPSSSGSSSNANASAALQSQSQPPPLQMSQQQQQQQQQQRFPQGSAGGPPPSNHSPTAHSRPPLTNSFPPQGGGNGPERSRPPSYSGSSRSEEMLVSGRRGGGGEESGESSRPQRRRGGDRKPVSGPRPPSSSNGGSPPRNSSNYGMTHPQIQHAQAQAAKAAAAAASASASDPNLSVPGASLGASIQRLKSPSVMDCVLQPLEAKVREYAGLMHREQDEMSQLDAELRILQERRADAETRFLEAKGKHDDYQRQHSDVERAMRGDPLPPPTPREQHVPLARQQTRPMSFQDDDDDDDDDLAPPPSSHRRINSQQSFGRSSQKMRSGGRFRFSLFGDK
ncbi:hypothetical protein M426DRAFT_93476 [Hypoxylon sp. CI-4A]|nr:hypothetical protein M426DRAFT_93476 [Hypoxylon sp. CI-4A]